MSNTDTELARRLADDIAIRNAIARLAHLADLGDDLDEYVGLFTPDATWEFPDGPRKGHADILAGASERREVGATGPGSNTRHIISTVAVDADGSDTATARSYWQFLADTANEPRVALTGAYDDTFVRTPDGWKLDRRVIRIG